MPLNEARSARTLRDRWPLEFDLEGVPRVTAERKKLLDQKRLIEEIAPMAQTRPIENQFAEPQQGGEVVRDLNNPPRMPYKFAEYPKMLYKHDTGAVLRVENEKDEKAALKRGFKAKPSPNHDYSNVNRGHAAPQLAASQEAETLSDDDLEAGERELEEEEN